MNVASRANELFERASRLVLTVFIEDPVGIYTRLEDNKSDPSNILSDTLLSDSIRWKKIRLTMIVFKVYRPIQTNDCIGSSLTAIGIALIRSVSFRFDTGTQTSNVGSVHCPKMHCQLGSLYFCYTLSAGTFIVISVSKVR